MSLNQVVIDTTHRHAYEELARRWRSPMARGRALTDLVAVTNQFGDVGMRVLLSVVSDSQLENNIRMHALWSLFGYWSQWNRSCVDHPWFDGMRGWLYDYCWFRPDPADAQLGNDVLLRSDSNFSLAPSATLRQLSLRPEARDTARAQLRLLVSENGQVGEAVAQFLSLMRWSEARDRWTAQLCAHFERDLPLAKALHGIVPVNHANLSGTPGWCTTTGPANLLSLWRSSGDDPAILPGLLGASIKMRDRRLHDGLLKLARDQRVTLRKREAALLTFSTYVHEGMSFVAFKRLEDSTRTASLRCVAPGANNLIMPQESGSHPLPADARDRDLTTLRHLARNSQPAEFRQMAKNILDCTELMMEQLPQTRPYPWLNIDAFPMGTDTTRIPYQDIANAECMTKESALMADAPNGSLSMVLSQFSWCPDAGAVLTARRWRSAPTDQDMLNTMVRYGVANLDERIFAAVLDVAGDSARARNVRVAALRVLFNYATRSGAPILGEVFSGSPPERRISISGFESANPQIQWGTQPVPGARQRVLSVFAAIEGEQGADDYVRLVVRELAMHIRALP